MKGWIRDSVDRVVERRWYGEVMRLAAARRTYRNAIHCRWFQPTVGVGGDGGKFALLANLLTEPKGRWREVGRAGMKGGWWAGGRWVEGGRRGAEG